MGRSAVAEPTLFAQQLVYGLQLGFVYALIALGYTLIYGIVKLINFAHGDVFMVGAYISYWAVARFHFRLIPAILLSAVACALLAVVMERVAYKPLRNAPRIAALITAIGMSFFLEYFAALDFVYTSNFRVYQPRPPEVIQMEAQNWMIGGVRVNMLRMVVVAVSLAFLAFLYVVVQRTKMGKAMRASSYDKPTARLMGINVDMVISFTFLLAASLAGAGGVLYVNVFPQVGPFLGIMPGLKAFVAAVVGGIGSVPGAFVGSLIIGLAEVLAAHAISSPMRDAIAFSVLIVVLLIRPQGIFGEPEAEKV
ncbi:MAG: branched-chain amino acid ABC transporter permease [Anaerolineae bacterium]|nr:branched-chain amino acid ABC transporter permease [Anaerolineae bacterium]